MLFAGIKESHVKFELIVNFGGMKVFAVSMQLVAFDCIKTG